MSFVDTALCQEYIHILTQNKPSLVIEIGGFDGFFSRHMYANQLCNSVYCFEASPYVHKRFSNLFNNKIHYINAAICDYTGEVNFKMQKEFSPEMIGHNSIKYRNDLGDITEETIKCYSLDDFFINILKDNDNIAIWIDAEGSSKDILLGMRQMLQRRIVSSIFIEVEHFHFWKDSWLEKDVDNFLSQYNYRLHKIKKQYDQQSNAIYLLNKS